MSPDEPSSTPAPEPEQSRIRRKYLTLEAAARHFMVTEHTIRNWIGRGFITGFRVNHERGVYVELNDVELALATHSRYEMRDGRSMYGAKTRIVTVAKPITVEPDVEP